MRINALKTLLGIETELMGAELDDWFGINALKTLLGIETYPFTGHHQTGNARINALKTLLGIETCVAISQNFVDFRINALKTLLGIETTRCCKTRINLLGILDYL